jgi:hypothetical protein
MPSSLEDFLEAWRAAAELKALEAAGAPADQVEGARTKARRKLWFVTDENLPGVVKGVDDKGQPAEFLDALRPSPLVFDRRGQPGDDWALVHYVMSLSGIEIPTLER